VAREIRSSSRCETEARSSDTYCRCRGRNTRKRVEGDEVKMGKKFVLTILSGGPGYTLEDNDLWGLETALEHGLQDGYFKENEEWAKKMLGRIKRLRNHAEKSNE